MVANEIAKLIERISNGDKRAEHTLFEQLDSRIEYIVRKRLTYNVPSDDFNDIVSNVKISLLDALRKGSFDPNRKLELSSYISGIARNHIALYFRKQKQNQKFTHETPPNLPDKSKMRIDEIIAAEERERIRKHLSKLKSIHQKVLLLRFFQGKSIDEISKILDLEKKQVIDLIHYALKKIKISCRKDNFFSIFSILLQIFL